MSAIEKAAYSLAKRNENYLKLTNPTRQPVHFRNTSTQASRSNTNQTGTIKQNISTNYTVNEISVKVIRIKH